jgi:Na+/proline symporter
MIPVTLGIIGSVTMPDLGNSERIIPALAMQHLHPVLVAIFVGAILAAIMSTCDSALHAVASLVSRILLPLVHKNPSDALTLKVARLAIPAVAVLGILIALKGRDIYDIMVDSNILSLTATTIPVLMVVWWSKANRIGALSAMVGGFLTWLISRTVAPELPGDLVGMGACLVIMVTVTLATQKIDPPKPARDIDGNIVEFKDRLGILRKS